MSGPAEPASTADRAAGKPGGWAAAYFADEKHGPLPALLLLLTIVTGLVDAASILALGRVFVANMTGNVVFVGFAPGSGRRERLLGVSTPRIRR